MTLHKARELRRNPTEAERALWQFLRFRQMNGHKFRRQHPIGTYIVDFACISKHLIIELDGGHHAQPDEAGYDQTRTQWLQSQGFQVLRFWNNQVLAEIESVKTVILNTLEATDRSQLARKTPGNPELSAN